MIKVYVTRVENPGTDDEDETVVLDLATDDDSIAAMNLRALAEKLVPDPWSKAEPAPEHYVPS